MRALLSCCLVLLLSASASPFFDVGRSETVLPLSRAWVDGQQVEYVTTDISDAAMAQMMGANHVPRLADALQAAPGPSLLERVYEFPRDEQISIFQSAPAPVGAGNRDRNYSPLWRVVLVHWRSRARMRVLRSEALCSKPRTPANPRWRSAASSSTARSRARPAAARCAVYAEA